MVHTNLQAISMDEWVSKRSTVSSKSLKVPALDHVELKEKMPKELFCANSVINTD